MDLRQRYGPPSYVYLCVFDVYLRYGPPSYVYLCVFVCICVVDTRTANTHKYRGGQGDVIFRQKWVQFGVVCICVYLRTEQIQCVFACI